MSRTLSTAMTASLLAQRTSKKYFTLLTLSGSGIATQRYVDNGEDITSGGNVYTAADYAGRVPSDIENQIPNCNIVFDNVDRTLISDIRSATAPPEVEINLAISTDESTVANSIEVGPMDFKVRAVDYNKLTIAGTLQYQDILNETVPDHRYSPQIYPGLYA